MEKKKIPKARFSHQILTMGSKTTQLAENYTCCQTLVLILLQQNPRSHFLKNQCYQRNRSPFFLKEDT